MASRNLSALDKGFKTKASAFKAAAAERGVEILIYCTRRSDEEQARLWRQGRSGRVITEMHKFLTYRAADMLDGRARPSDRELVLARACFGSGGLRRRAAPRSRDEEVSTFLRYQSTTIESVGPQYEDRVVTNAKPGESPHNVGMAFDCVPVVDGALAWSHGESWEILGEISQSLGIEWSGNWRTFVEKVHFQAPDWRERAAGIEGDLDGLQ